jgi:hypothetical protein
MSLATKSTYVFRRIVVAPYFLGADGLWRPERPTVCSCLLGHGPCQISFHRWRKRKCGPQHAVACFRCIEHGCWFTVYPPGWLPFGRRRMVHVSPDGFDVEDHAPGVESWGETAFGAAIDANASRLWPLSAGDFVAWEDRFGHAPYGVRRTQSRHVDGVLGLFAVHAELSAERARVAALLDLDLSAIVMAAKRSRDGPPLVASGAKGAELLSAAGRPSRRLLPGLIRLGADRQYWGPPQNTQHQTR